MKEYKSLFIEKENNLSNTIIVFNKYLSYKLKIILRGSPKLFEIIEKDNLKFKVIKYEFGSKGCSINYNVILNKPDSVYSIDIFLKPYSDIPSFTIVTLGLTLIKLLDLVIKTIQEQTISEEMILTESFSLHETIEDLSSIINALPDANKGLVFSIKQYFLNANNKDIKILINLIPNAKSGKDYMNILTMYNQWAKKNKQKIYSNAMAQFFKSTLVKALVNSGLKNGTVIEVKSGKKSKQKDIKTKIEVDLEKEMMKFRGTVNERFTEMEDLIEDVGLNKSYSTIIIGDPGVGKTFAVEEVLSRPHINLTVEEIDPQIEYIIDPETKKETPVLPIVDNDKFILVKGKVSPTALYNLLYIYNNALIVFDDSDDVLLKDPTLVKAATDDKARRKVNNTNAKTMDKKSVIPPSFLYTGRCIFVSNLYAKDIDSAIMSRGNIVELNLTSEEMIERAIFITPSLIKKIEGATKTLAQEVLDFLISINHLFDKLDLRTYGNSIKVRVRNSPDWKNRIARAIIVKNKSLKSQ